MFLKIKKMPKLFRFTAVDFASRATRSSTRTSRLINRGCVTRIPGEEKIFPIAKIPLLRRPLRTSGPIISALCSLIIFIAVTADRIASGFRRIDTVRWSCENRPATKPEAQSESNFRFLSSSSEDWSFRGRRDDRFSSFCVPFWIVNKIVFFFLFVFLNDASST